MIEIIISFNWELIIVDNSFVGRKPPDEIIVIARLKESNKRKSKILKIIKRVKVNKVYKIKILEDCFNISDVLNEIKLVNDFFKLLSKISKSKIIEKRKYKPPIHWEEDLHNIRLSSRCSILSKIVKPVEVKPEIDSK